MIYFFDTSALQHRYIDGSKSRGIRWTISSARNEVYIADLSILEIASAIAKHCRTERLSVARYERIDRAFWQDIRQGKVLVRKTTQRDYLRARHLIRYAGVEKKKHIGSSDALIAASCLAFALESNSSVKFCLEDWTLFHIIRDISAFSRVLDFRFIGVDKSKANP